MPDHGPIPSHVKSCANPEPWLQPSWQLEASRGSNENDKKGESVVMVSGAVLTHPAEY